MPPEVTYCVVNTNQRERLLRGLDAIAAEAARVPFATECLVLDNASVDGSADAARRHPAVTEVIALDRRAGKGENDSTLLQRTRGPYALLLNEDAELLPGSTRALHDALAARPDAAAAGSKLLSPAGAAPPSAWRFPTARTALDAAFLRHARNVQSTGDAIREVDWVQSSAMLVRRAAAEEVGWFDPRFFVYSDEVDFAKRLRDAGWAILWVPHAHAVHHEGLSTGGVPERRIVEFARNRDLYMRLHHGEREARAVRWLTAPPYALRAAAALVLPGHDPRRYWRHVTATLRPGRGEGIREAAEAFNDERSATKRPSGG